MSVGSSAELVVADLAGPPVRALPAAYFAQVYPQTAVVAPLPRGGCLYATPHGPEIKTMRSASTGKLPVISLFSALCLITVTNFCSFGGIEFWGVRGKLFVMPTWPDPETAWVHTSSVCHDVVYLIWGDCMGSPHPILGCSQTHQ